MMLLISVALHVFTCLLVRFPPVVESPEPAAAFSDDVLGLIVFKAVLIDPQAKLASWNEEDDDPCTWVGVKCDRTLHRVSQLVLTNSSLSGRISRSLLRLGYLSILSLSQNNFTGPINPLLAQLESLTFLDLSHNGLSGPIPDQLFQRCSSLKSVSFAHNKLFGSLPPSLASCSTLESVNFSSNHLSGQLPSELWYLSSLRSLDLSDNQFEGQIPTGIENLYRLRVIDLSKNNLFGLLPPDIGNCLLLRSTNFADNFLTGVLPESIRKLSLCTFLSLRGNSFTGDFPDWIADMTSLEIIDLSANNISGLIPISLGALPSLKEVNLSMNSLTGSLPDSIINCAKLKTLDASQNLLTGHIPSWIFGLGLQRVALYRNKFAGSVQLPHPAMLAASYGGLRILDLSSNLLSGEIPSTVGNSTALQVLNLSRNNLVGSIPSSVGRLNATLVLDLSHNRLNGSIPLGIGGAVSLQVLRLEANFLSGIIPAGVQNCSCLTSLILSRNNFTGPIPAAMANLTNLESIDLSFNQLNGSLPKELMNLSHLVSFNVSYNHLRGDLPVGGFFNTIPASSVTGNPSLCGSVVRHACPSVHPKPIVLFPNSSDSSSHGAVPSNLLHKTTVLSISSLVAIAAAAFIALGVVTVSILNLHAGTSLMNSSAAPKISGADDFLHWHGSETNAGKLIMFSGGNEDFASVAPTLLNKGSEIGHGGFGAVYKTKVGDGGFVAIKKLNACGLMKCEEDFEIEVKRLGEMRHQNLVALQGYYWSPSLQLLVNEYASGGSLYEHIHSKNKCLSWEDRYKVILGAAKGLDHLHQMGIIHYNIKSSNVLIDDFGEAKLGDFGLDRLLAVSDDHNRHILSSKTQSGLGYMAPEFSCETVKVTEKSDVYGFGVVMLEVVTGKRPVEYAEEGDVAGVCDLVRGALEEGTVEECIDHNLQGNYSAEEAIPVMKLGLICVSQVPSNRPDMAEVIRILELIQCPWECSGEAMV